MGLEGLRRGSVMNNESSRGALKFKKKIEFYAKVKDTVSTLTAEKVIKKKKKLRSRQKKLRVYDLSSLSEFLPQLKAPSAANATARTSLKSNSRSRQKLLEKEEKQLKGVLNHPAFQLDPLASIHQHLKSTQPVPPVQKPKNKFTKTGKRKKGKKSKASFEPQPMDIYGIKDLLFWGNNGFLGGSDGICNSLCSTSQDTLFCAPGFSCRSTSTSRKRLMSNLNVLLSAFFFSLSS